MRRLNLPVAKVLLGLLFSCLIPVVVLAQEESKAKDPAEENSNPEIHSQTRVKLGGISLGGFYRHYSGFDYYPYYYPYSSALWGVMPYPFWPYPDFSPAFYHPGYSGFSRSDGMGEIRLLTSEKSAAVFLDGAYAGVAEDLKSIWLEPGAYTLEVQGHGNERFKKRIYVLSGKTVKVNAALTPEREEARQ
jgi:PEGA domain